MRHLVRTKKIGKDAKHKKSLLRNLAIALFQSERIETTVVKAKLLRSFAEKLITRAKMDTLHRRRMIARALPHPQVVKKLFDDIGKRYENRPGGYTRIIKSGMRKGDGSEMCYLELTPEVLSSASGDKAETNAEKSAEPKTGEKKSTKIEKEKMAVAGS